MTIPKPDEQTDGPWNIKIALRWQDGESASKRLRGEARGDCVIEGGPEALRFLGESILTGLNSGIRGQVFSMTDGHRVIVRRTDA